jgi:Transposase DDE domain
VQAKWKIKVVERSAAAIGFEILPSRWIVERTMAWITRFRRLTRDFERYASTVAAFVRFVMIRIMLRRLTTVRTSEVQATGQYIYERGWLRPRYEIEEPSGRLKRLTETR